MSTAAKVLQRNRRWVSGAVITESVRPETGRRRFTATIRGWRNWFLWEGDGSAVPMAAIIDKAREIRDRIDSGDESVLDLKGQLIPSASEQKAAASPLTRDPKDAELEALRAQVAGLTAERDAYAKAALIGLSGIVGTPERDYVADGGPGLLEADMRRMRKAVARVRRRDLATYPLVYVCKAVVAGLGADGATVRDATEALAKYEAASQEQD